MPMQFVVEAALEGYQQLVDRVAARDGDPQAAARRVDDSLRQLFDAAAREAQLDLLARTQGVETTHGIGDLRLPSATDASRLAKALLRIAGKGYPGAIAAAADHPLRVGIHGADASRSTLDAAFVDILRAVRRRAPNNGLMISASVWDSLPSGERQAYGEHVEFIDEPSRQRLRAYQGMDPAASENGRVKRCFVIRPYADPRSDEVRDLYIRRACVEAGIRMEGSELQLGSQIIPEMLNALRDADLAVAYLGRPPWNANVMLEIGYRLAVSRPLVMLREKYEEKEDDEMLPFDIAAYRVIELPTARDDERDGAHIARAVGGIVDSMRELLGKRDPWSHPHPTATARFVIADRTSVYEESSPMADQLFGPLKDRTVQDFVEDIRKRMDPQQHEAFLDEQHRLFQEVVSSPFVQQGKVPVATVPIVLRDTPSSDGPRRRAYLPVVVNYWIEAGEVRLKILYLDVSGVVRKRARRDGSAILIAKLDPLLDSEAADVDECTAGLTAEGYFAPIPVAAFNGHDNVTAVNLALRVLLGAQIMRGGRSGLDGLLSRLGVRSDDASLRLRRGDRLPAELISDTFGRMKLEVFAVARPAASNGSEAAGHVFIDILSIEHDQAFRAAVARELQHQRTWAYYASSYDRVLLRLSYYREVRLRHVTALTVPGVKKVLDLGAGTGNVAVRLLEAGRQVTALDLSPAMLVHLQHKAHRCTHDEIDIVEQNAEDLGAYEDDAFDGISILMTLFDMDKPSRALAEAMRVLRPGGIIVVTEPHRHLNLNIILKHGRDELVDTGQFDALRADWARVTNASRELDPTKVVLDDSRQARLFIDDIATALQSAGFENVDMRDSHFGQCATVTARKATSAPPRI